MDDPIVAEVRKAREQIFRMCGHNLDELVRYLRRREKANRRKPARPRPKRAIAA